MNKIITLMLLGLVGMINITVAGTTYFSCGINAFAYKGDSIDKVIGVCGQPVSRKEYLEKNVTRQRQTTWHYVYSKMQPLDYETASGVPELDVIFADGKVIALNLGPQQNIGESVSCSYSSTKARSINLGDTDERVRLNCGLPRYVSNATRDVVDPEVQITELVYGKGQFMPQAVLIFKDTVLVRIQ